jgi:hypothetical protein
LNVRRRMTIYAGTVVGTVDGWLGDIMRIIRGIRGDIRGDGEGIARSKGAQNRGCSGGSKKT